MGIKASTTDLIPVKEYTFQIPEKLLKEFGAEIRIVIGPLVNGIPAPERLLRNLELLREISKECDIVLIPKKKM
jgi:hypothetical protein